MREHALACAYVYELAYGALELPLLCIFFPFLGRSWGVPSERRNKISSW